MINHSRTLLMNVDGSAPLPEYRAEEIVDPAYRAKILPSSVVSVRAALFGTTPDRHMLNYRCRQLLALVHATPLEPYLTTFDSRITYDFLDRSLIGSEVWGPIVSTIKGTGLLTTFGDPEPPDRTGRLHHSFLVSVNTPGVAHIERVTAPISIVDLEFTPGDRLDLPLVGVQIKLSSDDSGQMYRVDVYSRLQRDLAALTEGASNLGEPVYLDVFGLSRAEPFNTFRELWNRKQELPLRLSALVCALVYRTEGV